MPPDEFSVMARAASEYTRAARLEAAVPETVFTSNNFFRMFHGYLTAYARDFAKSAIGASEAQRLALSELETIMSKGQNALTPLEQKAVTAVLCYLRAETMTAAGA